MTDDTIQNDGNGGNVVPFTFEPTGTSVRAMEIDGEPWFVAKDVATALGYDQTSNALKLCRRSVGASKLDESCKNSKLPPATKFIPESDLYRLIMRSNLPSAERFQDWVVEEVLPQIRKTGAYSQTMTTADRLIEMAYAYKEHETRIMQLEKEQDATKQKIDDLLGGEDYSTVRGYAKVHGLPGDRVTLNAVGRKAAKHCKERGIRIGRVHDEVWGEVNSYPRSVLKTAYH